MQPRLLALLLLVLALTGCALLTPRDPLHIDLVGLEPLPGQGMEMRFTLVLRVKNPNDSPIDYDGIALELDVNHQALASGVSDQSGQVPRYGEALLRVPLSISALSIMRQAWAATGSQAPRNMPYELHGKLGNGLLSGARFSANGTLDWPPPGPRP